MTAAFLQYGFYLAVLVLAAIPLGAYIAKIMKGEKTLLSPILMPCEKAVYKILGAKSDDEMTAKQYLRSVLVFSGAGLCVLFLLQLLQ